MKGIRATSFMAIFAAAIVLMMSAPALGQLAERVLPNTTRGVVVIADGDELSKHWHETQVAKLLEDPIMQPFQEDLERQLEDEISGARERLGLTLDDIRGVPSGEISFALMHVPGDKATVALLMDVTGHPAEAQAFLQKVSTRLVAEGAKQSTVPLGADQVMVFELPREKPEDMQLYAHYILTGETIIAADKMETVQLLVERLAIPRADQSSLAAIEAYQTVMRRCVQDAPGRTPQIRWFIEPLAYAKAIRDTIPGEDVQNDPTIDILEREGFGGIQGVGGFLDFTVDAYEAVYRSYVYAPAPRENSMKMLVFPNGETFQPEAWVPRNCAKYSTMYVDPLAVFDNSKPLVAEAYLKGNVSVLESILRDFKEGKHGPKVDIREELIGMLTGRVSFVVDCEREITEDAERMVVALETNSAEAVDKAVEKLLIDDVGVERHEFEGHIIWVTYPIEDIPEDGGDGLAPVNPLLGGGDDAAPEPEPLFPELVICVAKGHIFVATDEEFLKQILHMGDGDVGPLAKTVDFRVIEAATKDAMKLLGDEPGFLRSFARLDEAFRPTYELIRRNKLPESETVLAKALNLIFPPDEGEAVRHARIDGSKLPEFDAVRRHFGPGGSFGVAEEDGWFFKGFLLTK